LFRKKLVTRAKKHAHTLSVPMYIIVGENKQTKQVDRRLVIVALFQARELCPVTPNEVNWL
jgi:hypothetical protein